MHMNIELLIKILALLFFTALLAGCEGETLTLEVLTSPMGTTPSRSLISTPERKSSPPSSIPTLAREEAQASPPPPTSPRETPQPLLRSTPPAWLQTPPQAQEAVEAARAFLVDHLEVPVAQIQLLYVEPETWSDASLGCSGPGRYYAQVVTPGYRVVFQVETQQYELHTDRSASHIVLCTGSASSGRVPPGHDQTQ